MSWENAQAAIGIVFQTPSPTVTIEFQGGEPLLAFDLIRRIVHEAQRLASMTSKRVEFVIVSNLALLDDEVLAFCSENGIMFSTSLDGPEALHNAQRPRPDGDAHARVVSGIHRIRESLGRDRVSAMMTTTRATMAIPEKVIDEFIRLGFTTVVLRTLSPYGFAQKSQNKYGYDAREFNNFYDRALDHMLDLNRKGVEVVEGYSRILLRRMLSSNEGGYVDLMSPAGAVTAAIVYNYDGFVYASDEGRMIAETGDFTFRLGRASELTLKNVFRLPIVQALIRMTVLESSPGCSDCAYLPFCGADPLFHYVTQGDPVGFKPISGFCIRHRHMFRRLFELLRSGSRDDREVLRRWARTH